MERAALRMAISGLAACSIFAGCTVQPTVTYSKITKVAGPASDLTDSYFLQSSSISISKSGTHKDDGGNQIDDLSITSTPVEYPEFKLGIKSSSSWLGTVNTIINITKTDNSSIVKEIGIQISDKRVDTIKTVGSIVSTVIPLAGFSATDELDSSKLPWSTKTYTQIAGNSSAADSGAPIQMDNGVAMTLGPLPPDAISVDKLPLAESSNFVYAACRDATISFKYTQMIGKTKQTTTGKKIVKIADPRYYEVVAFPVKGKITTHTECGASVTTEADTGVSSGEDLVNALAAQGKAIKDAIESSKSSTPPAKK